MANMQETMERELKPRCLFPEMPAKISLRPDEVMLILGCSDEHIRHLVQEGSLAAVDIRSAVCRKPSLRIITRSVVDFIQKRKTI